MENAKETKNSGFKRFFGYWGETVASPARTFDRLIKEESIWFGFSSVLVYSILYVITAVFMYLNRLRPVMSPFLSMSEELYYSWQMFFAIPVCLAGWILLGGIAYLFAGELFKGEGRLKDYLNVLGFSFYVPSIIVIWLIETIVAIFRPNAWGAPQSLGTFWGFLGSIYLYVGIAWILVLSIVAVKKTGNLCLSKSVITGVIAVVVTVTFHMIFIR